MAPSRAALSRPGLLPDFLTCAWCLLSLEHCPELQPPWQGDQQPSWPSATILFLSAIGQSPISTRMVLPTSPLPQLPPPLPDTNECFHFAACTFTPAVLPLLCSPPSTRWEPRDIYASKIKPRFTTHKHQLELLNHLLIYQIRSPKIGRVQVG